MAKNNTKTKKDGFFLSGKLDVTFLSFVMILLTVGLVMLFSASYAYSYEYYNNSYRFILKQASLGAVGVVLMLI
ncbi:MAG: hypothetical protein IKN39_00595, partial [Clostridia bacterium]|nr:hypothetical protein [Clostridia bacterium]